MQRTLSSVSFKRTFQRAMLWSFARTPHHACPPSAWLAAIRLTACRPRTKGMPTLFVHAVYICAFVYSVGPLFHLCFCGRSAVQGTLPAVCGWRTRQYSRIYAETVSVLCAEIISVLCAEIVSVFCAETVSVFGGMLLRADVQSARFS